MLSFQILFLICGLVKFETGCVGYGIRLTEGYHVAKLDSLEESNFFVVLVVLSLNHDQ